MNEPNKHTKENQTGVGNAGGFSDYIRKVQKELSDDYLIEVYIGLYLRALRSDGVLNYEEKVWFADRVKELYDIDVFKPIQARYTREEFMEQAKRLPPLRWKFLRSPLILKKKRSKSFVMSLLVLQRLQGTESLKSLRKSSWIN